MYPARIEVADPMRNEIAVYGKFMFALPSSLFISCMSTVTPRMIAKTAAKILRYKYSWFKKEMAPCKKIKDM